MHDVTMDIGEAEVAAGVAERQAFMVEAHEVKDRRVKIVNMHGILGDAVADVVGRAMNHAALDAAAGKPAGKGVRMMGPALRPLAVLRPR